MKAKRWVVSILKGERLDVHRVHLSRPSDKEVAKAAAIALAVQERGLNAVKDADVRADAVEGHF